MRDLDNAIHQEVIYKVIVIKYIDTEGNTEVSAIVEFKQKLRKLTGQSAI